jgi:hypothetical protein
MTLSNTLDSIVAMTSITSTTGAWPTPHLTPGKAGAADSDANLTSAGKAPRASTVVHLSGGRGTAASATYGPPARVTFDYFSFGEQGPHGSPAGSTRLEYNAYRPDGLAIDAGTTPYTVKATGERLTAEVARKYEALLHEVSRGRIDIFNQGKAEGLPSSEILARLQAYDRGQPESYRALVGHSSFSDPAQRYTLPTHAEVMGGPVQSE